jgi:hypothetical protein
VSEALLGETPTEATAAALTVTVADALFPDVLPSITADPGAIAVISPRGSMTATEELLEAQLTDFAETWTPAEFLAVKRAVVRLPTNKLGWSIEALTVETTSSAAGGGAVTLPSLQAIMTINKTANGRTSLSIFSRAINHLNSLRS